MKKILEFIAKLLIGTSFLWLGILGGVVAEVLSNVITMDMIMTVLYIAIAIAVITLIKFDI